MFRFYLMNKSNAITKAAGPDNIGSTNGVTRRKLMGKLLKHRKVQLSSFQTRSQIIHTV